ncbi:MAG: MarR family winged helix-turn-helix transcriptional regulator [Bacteroidota bacterium]|nr:MarR family winged helix-turn-helix transcriptional regulator [Bacteroidota bacterium]MDP3145346.1 MarR family winged helix-turn-helix transcriptional regulator [Bacteroidota bacterium]
MVLVDRLNNISKLYHKAVASYLNGLSIDRYYIILFVINESKKKLTQKEISEIIHVEKSSMVQMIYYLVKSGYVKRVSNSNDRRQNLIYLTEKADKDISLINNAYKKADDFFFKNIPKKEVIVFKQSLNIMLENLKELR